MPANKQGTQLLISPHIKSRGQALAIVRQESVAEIWRILVEQALPGMEAAHAGQLQQLRELLEGMNVDYGRAVDAMVTHKPRVQVTDLYTTDGRPRVRFPVPLT